MNNQLYLDKYSCFNGIDTSVRLVLGLGLRAAWPQVLPETDRRRAVHADYRRASAQPGPFHPATDGRHHRQSAGKSATLLRACAVSGSGFGRCAASCGLAATRRRTIPLGEPGVCQLR